MDGQERQFFGKYRGIVVGTLDPEGRGRLLVAVPAIGGGDTLGWALPCVAPPGPLGGLPAEGTEVWVEFEGGDISFPIWSGGWWGTPPGPQPLGPAGRLTLDILDRPDPDGGLTLRTASGATLSVTDAGITLSTGKGATLTLQGPTVDINDGAFTVT